MSPDLRRARLPLGKVYEEEILAPCEERLNFYDAPKALEFRSVLPRFDIDKLLGCVLVREKKARAVRKA